LGEKHFSGKTFCENFFFLNLGEKNLGGKNLGTKFFLGKINFWGKKVSS
jgi:hypothetical protein